MGNSYKRIDIQPPCGAYDKEIDRPELNAKLWDEMKCLRRESNPLTRVPAPKDLNLEADNPFPREHNKSSLSGDAKLYLRPLLDPLRQADGLELGELKTKNLKIEPAKFDEAEADKLIRQLGSFYYKERQEAQTRLEKMGTAVIPKLEIAAKSPDIEVRSRAASILEHNKLEDFIKQSEAMEGSWKKLLGKVDARMSNDVFPPLPGGGDNTPVILTGKGAKPSSKEDQAEFDKLLKQLDIAQTATPEYEKRLIDMQARISAGDETPGLQQTYDKLYWLGRANREAKRIYASTLANSKDPADLKKGAQMITDHLENEQGQISPYERGKVAAIAIVTGSDKDPRFLKAFERTGGTRENIEEVRKDLANFETGY